MKNSAGRGLSAQQAEAKRKLLGMSRYEVVSEVGKLARAQYSRVDAHRWFVSTEGTDRGPPLSLAIYLRLAIKEAWRARCERRQGRSLPKTELHQRATRLILNADAETLARFEKRLRLSEYDLAAAIVPQTPKSQPASPG